MDAVTSITRDIAATTIPRDRVVGAIYGVPSQWVATTYRNMTCPVTKQSVVSGTLVPGYTDVYQTSNPGVGVRFEYSSDYSGSAYVSAPRTEVYTVPSSPNPYSIQFYRRVRLVVIGPVTTGMLSSLPSMTITFSGSCFTSRTTSMTLTGGVITGHTCSVTTPSVNVTLPPVSQSNLIPAGTAAGDTGFVIGLDCTAGSNVFITLTDSVDNTNRTALLTPGPASTTQGVRLRILRDGGVPVLFGADSAVAGNTNQFLVGSSGSVTGVNLTAQYISTGTVVPGTINAAATFTMSYQ